MHSCGSCLFLILILIGIFIKHLVQCQVHRPGCFQTNYGCCNDFTSVSTRWWRRHYFTLLNFWAINRTYGTEPNCYTRIASVCHSWVIVRRRHDRCVSHCITHLVTGSASLDFTRFSFNHLMFSFRCSTYTRTLPKHNILGIVAGLQVWVGYGPSLRHTILN